MKQETQPRDVLDDIALDADWNSRLDTTDALPGLDTLDEKEEMDALITKGRSHRERSHFHASAVLKKPLDYYKQPLYCERECVLSQFYQTNEVIHPPKKQMIFDNGWDFHVRWQEMFRRAGVLRMAEVPFFVMRHHLQFTMDGVIDFAGAPHVLELKGYNSREFLKLLKGKIPEDAYLQCQLYLHLYRDTDNRCLEDGLIIVECKDTQEYKMWRIKRNRANVNDIIDRLYAIDKAAALHEATGVLPLRICAEETDKRACECSMRDACFQTPMGRHLGMRLENRVPDNVTLL